MDNKLSSIELRQQLSQIISDDKTLYDTIEEEKRDFTPEEEGRFEANAQRAEQLKSDIGKAEKREYLERQEADLAKPIRRISPEVTRYHSSRKPSYNGAFRAWLTAGKCS